MGLLLHGLCSAHHDVRRVERVLVSAGRLVHRDTTSVAISASNASAFDTSSTVASTTNTSSTVASATSCVATVQRDEKGATRTVRAVLHAP